MPPCFPVTIDANTGIVVNKSGIIEVIGEGAVYFIDGSTITYTNVSELKADEILSMHNVKLHILTDGNKFNLIKKSPFEEEQVSHEDNTKENI